MFLKLHLFHSFPKTRDDEIMITTLNETQSLIECCICCDYLNNVRESPCCHQLFCLNCIESWLNKSGQICPRCCSTEISKETLLRNMAVQNYIDNMQFDCPNKLQGCSIKLPRSQLFHHKQSCSFAPEKLTYQREQKLSELRLVLQQELNGKTHGKEKDNALYELAKAFYKEHGFDEARQCLKMIKSIRNAFDIMILSAQIEQDDGRYEKALEFFTDAI